MLLVLLLLLMLPLLALMLPWLLLLSLPLLLLTGAVTGLCLRFPPPLSHRFRTGEAIRYARALQRIKCSRA